MILSILTLHFISFSLAAMSVKPRKRRAVETQYQTPNVVNLMTLSAKKARKKA